VLSIDDIDSKRKLLLALELNHCEVVEFLRGRTSESHIIPSRTLANRIENEILEPIRLGIELIDIIEEIGIESVPHALLENWALNIEAAIISGGSINAI